MIEWDAETYAIFQSSINLVSVEKLMPILNSWQKIFDEALLHFTIREFRAHFPTRFFPSSIYTPFGSTEEAEEVEGAERRRPLRS